MAPEAKRAPEGARLFSGEAKRYFVVVLLDVGWFVPLVEVCELLVPWFIVDVEPMSVDDWFALTELLVLLLPLPTFTPGLMFAPAFTSELATPTFAFTPTFGFTFSELEVDDVEGDVELVEPEVPLVEPEVPLVEPVPRVELPEPLSEPLVLPFVVPVVEPVPLREPLVEPVDPVEPIVPLDVVLPLVPRVPVEFVEPLVVPLTPPAPTVLPDVPDDVVDPVALPPVVVESSSMQSLCTGLAECSLALPVSLCASLPAFGFL